MLLLTRDSNPGRLGGKPVPFPTALVASLLYLIIVVISLEKDTISVMSFLFHRLCFSLLEDI